MKAPTKTNKIHAAPDQHLSGLEILLADPLTWEFLGSAFCMKLEILAGFIRGDCNLADVARRHKVTRAAASKQAVRARRIYGMSKRS